jgi:hypothetical protein
MRRIDRVYVATHRGDLAFTRICVASVRRWYPDIPLYLIKDEIHGSFSTRDIEHYWGARVYQTRQRHFGWGFAKLEPLFDAPGIRYLILDSDIVLLGRVIDALEAFSEDFVVQEERQPAEKVKPLYFDVDALRERFDPAFRGPAFTFNTGQYVASSGALTRDDFDDVVEWSSPPRVRRADIFNPSEQGVLNYVILRALAAGRLTVARSPFMKWGAEELRSFDVRRLDSQSPYPYVIHWAGLKARRMRDMLRADILREFENAYYRRMPLGVIGRLADTVGDELWRLRHAALLRAQWLRRRLTVARGSGRE